MDAAYCSAELHEHFRSLDHVPLIDHHPRGGAKDEFEPADAIRYNERTAAEHSNARLKDEFGGRHVRVQGADKVMALQGTADCIADHLRAAPLLNADESGLRVAGKLHWLHIAVKTAHCGHRTVGIGNAFK